MLGAGRPQDTGLATLGIAALSHSGLSQPNRARRQCWRGSTGEEAQPAWLWLWKSRL